MAEIVNKIKQSKLETVDLEKLTASIHVKPFDMKEMLYEGLILREKQFRELLKEHDWEQYKDSYLAVFCSTDAIIPKWAYMLVVQYAHETAKDVLFGEPQDVFREVSGTVLDQVNWEEYSGKFVLLKGCSKAEISSSVYMHATKRLLPHVRKLMYGEACSNVPVFNQKPARARATS